jgi:hypothetical protein
MVDRNSAVKGVERANTSQFDGNSRQFDNHHERLTDIAMQVEGAHAESHWRCDSDIGNVFFDQPAGNVQYAASTDGSSSALEERLDIRDVLMIFHGALVNNIGDRGSKKDGSDLGEEGDGEQTQGWFPF